MHKYLRIAVSALSLTACVLLIALWVRSLGVRDSWRRCDGKTLLNIQSYRGELGIGYWAFPKPIPWQWSVETFDEPAERLWPPMKDKVPLSYVGIRWQTMPPLNLFAVRYWCPIVLTATLAILPWLSRHGWRFSLRALLIATTLIAAVLGIIAASR
jgi:hypothetical protein